MEERRTRRRRGDSDDSDQGTEPSETPSVAPEQLEGPSVGGVAASAPASASMSHASVFTTQVSADQQRAGLTPEVQAHISEAIGSLGESLRASLLEAIQGPQAKKSSPASSQASREWSGTYAGVTGLWRQDSDSGSWILVENPPTDPFQSPEGDPWRRDGPSRGGVAVSAPTTTQQSETAISAVVDPSRVGGVADSAPTSSYQGYYDYSSGSGPYRWTPPTKTPKKEFIFKDPPPTWNGKDPEAHFRDWMRELEHWENLTSYPEINRGISVYKSLAPNVKSQVKHLDVGTNLYQADVLSKIKEVLLRNYSYVGKYEAQIDFEKAMFKTHRVKGQSVLDFIHVFQDSFWKLESHGEFQPMDDKQKGLLFMKYANLSQVTEDNIRMKTDGVYTLSKIIEVVKMLQPRPDALTGHQTQTFLNIDAHKDDDPSDCGGAADSAPTHTDGSQETFVDNYWWDDDNQCWWSAWPNEEGEEEDPVQDPEEESDREILDFADLPEVLEEHEYVRAWAIFRGPSTKKRRPPSSKAKGRGKRNPRKAGKGKPGRRTKKGKGKSSRPGFRKNYGQIRKDLNGKLLSRGFVIEKKHFNDEEDSKMLARTRCFRCQQLGHVSRNCTNAPVIATGKTKTTSVGFSQDFFTDVAKDGSAAVLMISAGGEAVSAPANTPQIPTIVGGDAVSAPADISDDETDSELEFADPAAPLNPIPAILDGVKETFFMVEYKDAFQNVNDVHALEQMKLKYCHMIVKRELRLLRKYLDDGDPGDANFRWTPFKLNFTGDQPISTRKEIQDLFPVLIAGHDRLRELWVVYSNAGRVRSDTVNERPSTQDAAKACKRANRYAHEALRG